MAKKATWRSMIVLIGFLLSIWFQSNTVSLPNIFLSTTEVLSSESTENSVNPNLAIDSKDNVHVVWADFTNYAGSGTGWDIFYKFWNATSMSWSIIEVVSTESTGWSRDPSLAIDSKDNVHVVWYDLTNHTGSGTDEDIFYKFWNTTSMNWSITEVVSTESTGNSNNPGLAIDSKDSVHVVWEDYTNYAGSGIGWDIFYKFWNTTSMSWSTTEVVSTESTGNSNNPSIAIENQDILHVVWDDTTNYTGSGTDRDIFAKFWNTTSMDWSTTEVLSTESTGWSEYSGLAIDSKDVVHVVWHDSTNYTGSGTEWDIFYKFWNVTSMNWSTTEVISTESTGNSFDSSLAIDSKDAIHVAWYDSTNYEGAGSDADIFYKFWNITSMNWSNTEVVSTQSTGNSIIPRLAIDSKDIVHVVWYDLTDYAGSGTDADIFYKVVINLNSHILTEISTVTDTEISTVTDIGTSTVTNTETVTGPIVTQTTTNEVEGSIQTTTEIKTENASVPLVPILLAIIILSISRIRKKR